MKPRQISTPSSDRTRQIGRKVLQADRLSRALNPQTDHAKFTRHVPKLRPKVLAAMCAAVLIISTLGFTGVNFYLGRQAAAQKIAAEQQQREQQAKSIAADACRRKKVEEKADQIGKLTYDQLYDNNECDK